MSAHKAIKLVPFKQPRHEVCEFMVLTLDKAPLGSLFGLNVSSSLERLISSAYVHTSLSSVDIIAHIHIFDVLKRFPNSIIQCPGSYIGKSPLVDVNIIILRLVPMIHNVQVLRLGVHGDHVNSSISKGKP